jgi:hypothetical protein
MRDIVMADKTIQSPPEVTDFMQKAHDWFGPQRQYLDCKLSWGGLKSRFGICHEKELKAQAEAADAAVTDTEKRLPPTGPNPQ